MKKFFNEFRLFISKGNVLDLAVAVIMGAAFGKIVTSLVNDVIMPLITAVLGANSLAELSITLRAAVLENDVVIKEALLLNWGKFVQSIIDFIIIAFVVFMFVKTIMAAKKFGDKVEKYGIKSKKADSSEDKKEEDRKPPEVPQKTAEQLLAEIRDLLIKQSESKIENKIASSKQDEK